MTAPKNWSDVNGTAHLTQPPSRTAPYSDPELYTKADLDAHIGAALNDAAQMVDCCCDQETKARVLSAPPNSAERWRGCGQANCGAMDAQVILALRPTALTALDRAKREARVEALEQAAEAVDRIGPRVTGDAIRALISANSRTP